MKMHRRHFLKIGAFQSAALLSTRVGQTELQRVSQRQTLSILQGMTDYATTELSVMHDYRQRLQFMVSDEHGKNLRVIQLGIRQKPYHDQVIQQLGVTGLKLGTKYTLRVFDEDRKKVIDERFFHSLDLQKESLNYALCSCMNDQRHDPTIWNSLIEKRPDLILFVGDSVYADDGISTGVATPEHLWKRFCEARQTLEIYHSKQLIPILATWDDHDIGMDDADCVNYPFIRESQENFMSFFAQSGKLSRSLVRGPGVSSAVYISRHLIFLMDDRSFRLPREINDRYSHWGREQEEWMFTLLEAHRGPSVICNGSQFFPEMIFKESFSGDHAWQFQEILQRLSQIRSKAQFISGDVHYSEITHIDKEHIGYETFEITSSSIHSITFPGILDIVKNKKRIAGTSRRNFVMIESRAYDEGAQAKALSYGADGRVLFQKNISTTKKTFLDQAVRVSSVEIENI